MQGGKDLVGGYQIIFWSGLSGGFNSKEIAEEAEEEEEAIARGRKIGLDAVASG
jgi:hypothetical protein